MVPMVCQAKYLLENRASSPGHLYGLIFCPTRGLAEQTMRQLRLLCTGMNVVVESFFGGMGGNWLHLSMDIDRLARANIAIVCPGRWASIMENLNRFGPAWNSLFNNLKVVVIEHADTFEEDSWQDDMDSLSTFTNGDSYSFHFNMPATVLVSANPLQCPSSPSSLLQKFGMLPYPATGSSALQVSNWFWAVVGESQDSTLLTVDRYCLVDDKSAMYQWLIDNVTEWEKIEAEKKKVTLIIVNQIADANWLDDVVIKAIGGAKDRSEVVHSGFRQGERSSRLTKLVEKGYQYFIVTGAHARGMNFPVDRVILMDLPLMEYGGFNDFFYRKGAAGRMGHSTELVAIVNAQRNPELGARILWQIEHNNERHGIDFPDAYLELDAAFSRADMGVQWERAMVDGYGHEIVNEGGWGGDSGGGVVEEEIVGDLAGGGVVEEEIVGDLAGGGVVEEEIVGDLAGGGVVEEEIVGDLAGGGVVEEEIVGGDLAGGGVVEEEIVGGDLASGLLPIGELAVGGLADGTLAGGASFCGF
jgi:superfamily II DNA/RNA helicase